MRLGAGVLSSVSVAWCYAGAGPGGQPVGPPLQAVSQTGGQPVGRGQVVNSKRVLRSKKAGVGLKLPDGLVPRAHPVKHQAKDPLDCVAVHFAPPDDRSDFTDGVKHRVVQLELNALAEGQSDLVVADTMVVDVHGVINERRRDLLLALRRLEVMLLKERRQLRGRRRDAACFPALLCVCAIVKTLCY